MTLTVEIQPEGATRPAQGSPITVQLRDTSLADAPAIVVAEATGVVRQGGECLDTVDLTISSVPRHATIWVHVDVDRDGRVTKGDYITTASYPLQTRQGSPMRVIVRLV